MKRNATKTTRDIRTADEMRNLPVRACSIENIAHPEWGTFGVYEDRGTHYEIFNRGHRVLSKDEAARFWRRVK